MTILFGLFTFLIFRKTRPSVLETSKAAAGRVRYVFFFFFLRFAHLNLTWLLDGAIVENNCGKIGETYSRLKRGGIRDLRKRRNTHTHTQL